MFFVLIGDSIAFCIFHHGRFTFPESSAGGSGEVPTARNPKHRRAAASRFRTRRSRLPRWGPLCPRPLCAVRSRRRAGGRVASSSTGESASPGRKRPPGPDAPTRRAGEAASRSPAVRSQSAVVVDFLMTRNDGSRHKAVLLAPKSNRCCFNCSYKKDKQFF